MSKGLEVAGVKSDEKAATYVYTLSADSGYRANETGRISADRHGLVCRALAGKLDDYDQLAEQREEFLEALDGIDELFQTWQCGFSSGMRPDDNEPEEQALWDAITEKRAAIANATQQRNATGGEG